MGDRDAAKRSAIRRLMREAASILSKPGAPDIEPVLPKMEAAVTIAEELEDKLPLVICQANLASMNAVCGNSSDALVYIERVLDIVRSNDHPVPIRNFAYTKFVEVAVMLQCESDRARTYALGLVECAITEEGDFLQYLMALFNLAVVSEELLHRPDWALAIISWIEDEAIGGPNALTAQARRYRTRVAESFPPDEAAAMLCEIEANRDSLLAEATDGYLPASAPEFSWSMEPANGEPTD